MKKTKLAAIARVTGGSPGNRSPLVVRRGGNAPTRDVVVRLPKGAVRLEWRPDGDSHAILLPPGVYTLVFYILGKKGETFAFELRHPRVQSLGHGTLLPLGAESYDRQVQMP